MKKQLALLFALFLLSLCAVAWADVPLDEAHFPDPSFRHKVKEADADSNGILSDAEIAAMKQLSAHGGYMDPVEGWQDEPLRSVKGIEYLTALEQLDVGGELSTLDLSHQAQLKDLIVDSDTLTSMDFTPLKKLNDLSLWCPNMSTVDFRGHKYLSDAYIEGSQEEGSMGTVRYSEPIRFEDGITYTYLLEILPGTNVLLDRSLGVDLNADNFPDAALRELLAEYDHNKNGRLGGYDRYMMDDSLSRLRLPETVRSLKGLQLLPEISEIELLDSPLTSLDISFLNTVKDFSVRDSALKTLILPKDSQLEYLNCYQSKVTSLDLSAQKNLRWLNVGFCELKELDLSHNGKMEDVYCPANEIKNLKLGSMPALYSLLCSDNPMKQVNISGCPKLKSLVKSMEPESGYFNDFSRPTYVWEKLVGEETHYLQINQDMKLITDGSAEEPEPADTDSDTVSTAEGTFVLSGSSASFKAPANKNASSLTIPATVTDASGKTVKVTAIADQACKGMKNLAAVTIGKNVKTIGKNAFASCTKLKTVKGGAAVVTIKDGAFSGCKVLKTFPTMNKLQKIGNNAFKGDKALAKFTLAKTVTSIGKNAFNGCAGLKTITVKTEKLTSKNVGAGAFKGIHKKATFKCPKKQLKNYKKLFVKKGAPKTCKFK